jgi:hypothetical protein
MFPVDLLLFHKICIRRCSRPVEDFCNLLQAPTLRFREEEVRNAKENYQQTAEHDVVLPPNILHTHWIDECLDYQRDVDGKQFATDTFGPKTIREDFGWVAHEKWRVGDVVVEVENEEADHHNVARSFVVLLVVDGRTRCPNNVREQHANPTPKEEGPSSQSIDEQRSAQSCDEVENLEKAIDKGLHERICDADRVQNEFEIVRDNTDAVPLRECSDADCEEESLAVAGRGHECAPLYGFGKSLFADGGYDLAQFPLDQRTILIAASMKSGKDLASFSVTLLCYEPSILPTLAYFIPL